jgi:putative ABC transport system substrate-binding protein
MRRRDFVAALGGLAAACPLAARAQQQMRVISFLDSGSATAFAERVAWFRRGLAEIGYTEGPSPITRVYELATGSDACARMWAVTERRQI